MVIAIVTKEWINLIKQWFWCLMKLDVGEMEEYGSSLLIAFYGLFFFNGHTRHPPFLLL